MAAPDVGPFIANYPNAATLPGEAQGVVDALGRVYTLIEQVAQLKNDLDAAQAQIGAHGAVVATQAQHVADLQAYLTQLTNDVGQLQTDLRDAITTGGRRRKRKSKRKSKKSKRRSKRKPKRKSKKAKRKSRRRRRK